MEWVRQKQCKLIHVSHRSGNKTSEAAIKRFGFKYTHTEEVNWPDGLLAAELTYDQIVFDKNLLSCLYMQV